MTLVLPPDLPETAAAAAQTDLAAALRHLGAEASVALDRSPLPPDFTRKLRRVECRLPPHSKAPS